MAALMRRGRGLLRGVAAPAAARATATSTAQTVLKAGTSAIGGLPSTSPHAVTGCKPINGGKQLVVEFADKTRYEVHATWLKDSSPSNTGADYYRKSAKDVWGLSAFKIAGAEAEGGGERLSVKYEHEESGPATPEVFEAKWLHSLAPFVGKALHAGAGKESVVRGTGSLMSSLLDNRTGWGADVEIPSFDAKELENDLDLQVRFYETMVNPGVAMVHNVGTPDSLEMELAGMPMEQHVMKTLGKMNQHPVRCTRYSFIQKEAQAPMEHTSSSSDYNHSHPLSMHTDHTVYHGTPGYLQYLYQAQGTVRSKVCDGLALAEYVKEHHPEAYELLTTVHMTHSSRNALYTAEGYSRNINDPDSKGMAFELVHTHPVIVLDAQGRVDQVIQSETKRGVCALPYSVYEPFMEAYALWVQLCEDPRFVRHFDWPEGSMVVTNNFRTMHGRATVAPEMARTVCIGYANRILVENRYRLLKQRQAERANTGLNHRWLTRVPNQALERMLA